MIIEKSNILYVDDERNNLIAFEASFRRYYNVFTANSGQDGLDIMRQNQIDVLITDQRMPEMTGVQFLEAIIPEFPDTIRMILTGFTDIEVVIKAINSGQVYRYITKPWDLTELKINIDTGVKLYRLEREKLQLIEKLNHEIQIQKRIMELFQKYVPRNIVENALRSENEELLVAGEYRIIAVMFADIRRFTTLSHQLGPEKSVAILNRFFELMEAKIKKHNGSINKLFGDGILALFGAPVSYINNSYNAVACGLAMLDALKELNQQYSETINHEIAIGIGIHTGEVIAGNIGTIDHIEYTVIGDTVNVASRIEELTAKFPNTILISESTYAIVKNKILVEELGEKEIRGKEKKMLLYKVIGKKNDT